MLDVRLSRQPLTSSSPPRIARIPLAARGNAFFILPGVPGGRIEFYCAASAIILRFGERMDVYGRRRVRAHARTRLYIKEFKERQFRVKDRRDLSLLLVYTFRCHG